MILKNLCTIDDEIVDIDLSGENNSSFEISFEKAIVFPGLINSHDHLDFNLFPQLGNSKYNNYTEWGKQIHAAHKEEIDQVLKIPLSLRTQWGVYKNLLCGVTTVVNHGEKLSIPNPLINIYQQGQNLHSTGFEKFWKLKLNNPLKLKEDCIIHIGEGIDKNASEEAPTLLKWNLFHRNLIGIHGISVSGKNSKKFRALVWCPASNYFLFGQTAPVNEWETKILFGTDSALTASGNIWDHLREARKTGFVTDKLLFNAVTVTAGELWKIPGYNQKENLSEDLVIARARKSTALDSFFEVRPEDILMVIKNRQMILLDKNLEKNIPNNMLEDFSSIKTGDSVKLVKGNLTALCEQIKIIYPGANFSFAGIN